MNKVCIWLLGAATAACLWMVSATGADAAKLLPTQVLVIGMEDGQVRVRSDVRAAGSGASLSQALVQLERSAEGRLFLDTAEHIVLEQGAQELVEQVVVQERFRPAAKLYLMQGSAEAAELAAFLQAHPGPVRLVQARALALRAEQLVLPRIEIDESGGMQLAG